jgi:hypothetical protein
MMAEPYGAKDLKQGAINSLSTLIAQQLQTQHGEEAAPRHGADQMDEVIADAKRRVGILREIRQKLEDLDL